MQAAQVGDATRLEVSGALDLATADQFTERVRSVSAGAPKVVLDLSGVDFMDSSGLAALLAAVTEIRRADRQIDVVPELGPQVARLLKITGVARILVAS
jgi:anti-anti-sigma factor